MKRKTTILLIILCAGLSLNMDPAPCVCDGESSNFDIWFTSWVLCVFYGDCQPLYSLYNTDEQLSFNAHDENDGITLKGSWKGEVKQVYYILTFEESGELAIAQHRQNDDYLLRYDRGKYSIDGNHLMLDMDNGAYSIIQFSIDNQMLILSKIEEQETVNTAD